MQFFVGVGNPCGQARNQLERIRRINDIRKTVVDDELLSGEKHLNGELLFVGNLV